MEAKYSQLKKFYIAEPICLLLRCFYLIIGAVHWAGRDRMAVEGLQPKAVMVKSIVGEALQTISFYTG
jgi:hypothetical protein